MLLTITANKKDNDIWTYHRDSFPGEDFFTYRKLKHIAYYYYFNELYKGVKAIVLVDDGRTIKGYDFNYNEAKDKGFDVILRKPLDIFENFSYVYVSDDYNEAMNAYLDGKLNYLKSAKDILVDTITNLKQEKASVEIQERSRLMDELESKINQMLDVYEEKFIYLDSKLHNIDRQLAAIDEMKKGMSGLAKIVNKESKWN